MYPCAQLEDTAKAKYAEVRKKQNELVHAKIDYIIETLTLMRQEEVLVEDILKYIDSVYGKTTAINKHQFD